MKTTLLVLLALALAVPALAFQVGTYNGYPCHHISSQMRWTHQCNIYGTPDCANEWQQFQTAQITWSNVSNQWFRHDRGPDTTVLNYGYDGVVLAVFYEPDWSGSGQGGWPWSSSTIAVCVYWLQGPSGGWYTVVHEDICFNGYNYPWSDSGAGGAMDVQNISAHELGHNLVLADLYSSSDSEKTMYGYSSYGETKKRTLDPDDEAGIRYIYPITGIALEKFEAAPRDGGVDVSWRVADEGNVAGYNLYRRLDDGRESRSAKLNDALITGSSPFVYRDETVAPGKTYKYVLEAVDLNGKREQYGPVAATLPGGVKTAFGLAQSWPNPARDSVTLKYSLAEAGQAKLAVYDLSGRKVATLVNGAETAGEHEKTWDLTADTGAPLAPGAYVYRLEANGTAATRRLVVAR